MARLDLVESDGPLFVDGSRTFSTIRSRSRLLPVFLAQLLGKFVEVFSHVSKGIAVTHRNFLTILPVNHGPDLPPHCHRWANKPVGGYQRNCN